MKNLQMAFVTSLMLVSGLASQVTATPQRIEECPGTNRALVIAGGGVKGAYEVGALWYLTHVLHCRFDYTLGTSTGAITASVVASASDATDLRERVNIVRDYYASLRSRSQIVKSHPFGLIRLFLPHWLGGVDGLANLRPLEEALGRYMRTPRPQDSRSILPVVSLQAGRVDVRKERIEDPAALVTGSASTPFFVEPRRSRVWIAAMPMRLDGEKLVVGTYGEPGSADPACRVRFEDHVMLPCKQLAAVTHTEDDVIFAGAATLELTKLSPAERAYVKLQISRSRPVEVSMSYQLIDGGVTDNVPFEDAAKLFVRSKVDAIYVLLAGHRVTREGANADEVHGIKALQLSLEILWRAYQDAAFRETEQIIARLKDVCRAYRGQQLHGVLNLREFEGLGSVGGGLGVIDCDVVERWQVFVIDPPEPLGRHFSDFLDVDHGKILTALRTGCMEAALVMTSGYPRVWSDGRWRPLLPPSAEEDMRAACGGVVDGAQTEVINSKRSREVVAPAP